MGMYLLTIGATMFLCGYIWIGIVALKNDPVNGKWAFLSGMYRINYCKANWDKMKFPCLSTIIGMLLIFIGIIL